MKNPLQDTAAAAVLISTLYTYLAHQPTGVCRAMLFTVPEMYLKHLRITFFTMHVPITEHQEIITAFILEQLLYRPLITMTCMHQGPVIL
jgi:hypothetical protein